MKSIFGNIMAGLVILLVGVGYINNIIWMLDNWSLLGYGSKFFNIGGIFIPPLGGYLGIYHLF